MTNKCETCEDVEKRISKWIDHVNCTPLKYQRYDLLIAFVKMVAAGTTGDGTESSMKECIAFLNWSATNLLKEFKEYEILRSNGTAKGRKDGNKGTLER